jgi:hypothetical protein
VPEGVTEAAIEFSNEIAPQVRPRDVAGKFIATTSRPEPMFSERPIEGEGDGGDDQRLRARERELQREPDDSQVEEVEQDPENVGSQEVEPSDEEPEDDGQKYEITVDGQKQEISLQEALNGYIRQDTFHKRMAQVQAAAQELDVESGRLAHGWKLWHKARQDYEEDLANLVPKEPDWDVEFARDPQAAHAKQKIYQAIYGKLATSRQMRAEREVMEAQENDRRTQKYAVDGFSQFVMHNIKTLPDEATLKKNIQSMRRTAMAEGFNEYEVATVYDPRMLTILLKASKYDRMQASRLRPVDPSRGKSVSPGAATPIGNARRSGFDQAQRQLASSGKLQDAVEVFRRML